MKVFQLLFLITATIGTAALRMGHCSAQETPTGEQAAPGVFAKDYATFLKWAGLQDGQFGITLEKLRNFLEARSRNIASANQQGWAAWLKAMEQAPQLELRTWALARRLEGGDVSVYPEYENIVYNHVVGISKPVQPAKKIGALTLDTIPNPFIIDASSGFWKAFEKIINENDNLFLSANMYTIWCFNTHPNNRDLIFRMAEKVLLKEKKGAFSTAWDDPRFWILAEWLYSWGNESDFSEAIERLPDKAELRLSNIFKEAKNLPRFFESSVRLQNPARLPEWHNPPNDSGSGIKFPPPIKYPRELQIRQMMTVLTVDTIIGEDGKPVVCRPRPGPWLSFFFPTVYNYVMACEFEPLVIDGKPVESKCITTFTFKAGAAAERRP